MAAAFQQRLVALPSVEKVLQRFPTMPRHRLVLETARDAAGGFESISEVEFVDLCRRGRLPIPTAQTMLTAASGRRRYRDAYYEEWHVHVEIDGSQHREVATWWADMQRQNDMWISGERILRFPSWAIRHDPDRVIEQLRAALIVAGWSPKR